MLLWLIKAIFDLLIKKNCFCIETDHHKSYTSQYYKPSTIKGQIEHTTKTLVGDGILILCGMKSTNGAGVGSIGAISDVSGVCMRWM